MFETQLVSPLQHADIAIVQDAALVLAAKSHLVNLRANEISAAMLDVPVFFSRHQQSGQWLISGLYSFTAEQNLSVDAQGWMAGYLPMILQTYPLRWIPEQSQLWITLDPAVVTDTTTLGSRALFQVQRQPSAFLQQQKALLEQDSHHDYLTFQFLKTINSFGLIKEFDLLITPVDGGQQRIKGLATVDEDKLQLLSADQLQQLQQSGYLLLLHAMLLSIAQLNALIKRHNKVVTNNQLQHIKLELSRA